RNADLSGAILSSTTGLLQSQLHHACGDENTVLPKGLTITPCAEVTKEPGQKGNIAKGKYRQPPSPQKLAQQF
ncbi:MAG: pentapeptide repeat-containing protein, partial [Pseudomonadota bacterium]